MASTVCSDASCCLVDLLSCPNFAVEQTASGQLSTAAMEVASFLYLLQVAYQVAYQVRSITFVGIEQVPRPQSAFINKSHCTACDQVAAACLCRQYRLLNAAVHYSALLGPNMSNSLCVYFFGAALSAHDYLHTDPQTSYRLLVCSPHVNTGDFLVAGDTPAIGKHLLKVADGGW